MHASARATCNRRRSCRYMAVADEAVERKASSSAGLQLAQIAAAGNAAEKALLADETEKNPDASYIELLRLFKARRRRCLVCRCQCSLHWCTLHGI